MLTLTVTRLCVADHGTTCIDSNNIVMCLSFYWMFLYCFIFPFSVDGFFASCSHDRTAKLWSTERTYPLRSFIGHVQDVDVSIFFLFFFFYKM